MQIALRRGGAADGPLAAELWLRARRAAAGQTPDTVHPPHEVRAWFAGHVVTHTELWVAEDRQRTLVGILVLDGDWLDQLYVEPALTGRGVGAALLRLAKRRHPDGLWLWVFASNIGAQRFYERHGFAEIERTDGRDNEERSPDILYAWPGQADP
jgi:GNAT superfamily N-acetyltransferase